MNVKVKNYIEGLFSDVPRSKKAMELKEEMLANMNDRFDDYIKEGKTENEAYSAAVASMGDVDKMLSEVVPDEEFRKEAVRYSSRRALFIAIGVSLYILGVVVLIGMSCIGELVFHSAEMYAIIGLLVMLVMAAVATGLIIFGTMSTPVEYRDYAEQTKTLGEQDWEKRYKSVMSIVWAVILILYLAVSFTTMAWHITWILWPIAGIASGIVKTVFEMRNTK